MKGLPINAIMKVTRSCNLECGYCHDRKPAQSIMPFYQVALATQRILSIEHASSFRFIWHGGEPLLAGLSFFEKAMAAQQELRGEGQSIKNLLQTNGTLLSDEVLDFCEDFNFTLGISLDGPKSVHNTQRPASGGASTFTIIMNNISRLQERKIPFGTITVLTNESMFIPAREFLDFFHAHGLKDICFLPVRSDTGHTGYILKGRTYYRFMSEFFDAWLLLNDPEMRVRELGDLLLLSMGYPGSMCSSSGSCVGGTYSIESDGRVFHCDKFSRDKSYCFGNLSEIDFNCLPDSPLGISLRKRDLELPPVCNTCEWRKHCAGGCSHDRIIEKRIEQKDNTCPLQELLCHIREKTKDHPVVQDYVKQARQYEGGIPAV